VRWVLQAVFPHEGQPGKRFYITRRDAAGAATTRHVKNHLEISEILATEGFETVAAQDLNFQRQLDIFRSAKYLVMDGGAALANLVFSPRCKQVFILAMHKGTDPSMFVSFCQALGIGVAYVGGPVTEGQEAIESWQRTYRIEIPHLLTALNQDNLLTGYNPNVEFSRIEDEPKRATGSA
jgi:capsular polysaccharide biosynthesis protein